MQARGGGFYLISTTSGIGPDQGGRDFTRRIYRESWNDGFTCKTMEFSPAAPQFHMYFIDILHDVAKSSPAAQFS